MKKLLIVMCAISIVACNQINGSKQTQKDSTQDPDTILTTLNGINLDVARKEVQYFIQNKKNDKNPDMVDIWFSKAVIDSMVKVLRADSLGSYKPDGIRIYFLSIPSTDPNTIPLNNNIAIVSTYNAGNAPETDYFKHATNGLFTMNDVGGMKTINSNSDTTNGAVLYKNAKNVNTQSCIVTVKHDIDRRTGEKMVQYFGKDTIKTKSEWFDIAMIDSLAKELDYGKDDGIRIYFAKHPKTDQAIRADREALIIITTRPDINPITGKGMHKDYFDCEKRYILGNGQDNGELCPSNCNGVHLP